MQPANYISFLNWQILSKEAGLSSSEEIDAIAEQNILFRPPTIIFGKNVLTIREKNDLITISFTAKQSLKYINYDYRAKSYTTQHQQSDPNSICYIPQKLEVKHANHWKTLEKPKDIQISQIKQSSDTFFITPFRGLISGKIKVEKTKQSVIPLEKLSEQNKITNYCQGSLYEDELDDNGLIQYEYKFRTMADSWFGLVRCYARIDEVAVHILDTRIYWQKGWKKVGRQFMVKKATWQQLKNKSFDFENGWTMNPNQSHMVYQLLNEVLVDNEYLHFQ